MGEFDIKERLQVALRVASPPRLRPFAPAACEGFRAAEARVADDKARLRKLLNIEEAA